MRTVSIKLNDMAIANIQLGFVGEDNATQVIFESESIFNDHPDAVQLLVVTPPEGTTYEVTTARIGNNVVWNVSDLDTAFKGEGSLQLTFTDDSHVIKTYNAVTTVLESQVPSGTAPDSVLNWIEDAEAWATGKRGGKSVEDEDPAYHNNSKYYSEQAEAAKTSAESAKDDAVSAKTDAETAKTAAEAAQAAAEAILPETVIDWLEENITSPEYPLDRSLTEPLAAAPADMVGNLKSAFQQNNEAEGIIPVDGGDGSYTDSTFTAIKTGNVIKLNGTYTASTRRRIKLSGDFAQGTSTGSAWYANTIFSLPGEKAYGIEQIEIGGSVSIASSDTNYALALFAYDTSGNIAISAYLFASGWRNSVISSASVNIGAIVLTVNKNYTFSNYELSCRLIEQIFSGDTAFVDGTSGNDTQIGSKTSPLKTITKALQLGFRDLCVKPGRYNELIAINGGRFRLVPWADEQSYDGTNAPYRPKIKIIKGTKLTVTATGTTGVYSASYTADSESNIYKVFVSHTVDPTTSGSLALEYNALLVGDMPNTSTASKAFSPYRQRFYTPVLTEQELSSEGTFWYDGTNHVIKFHAWNDTADGEYYIPDDSVNNAISLQNMESVYMEDVKALGCYGNCIYINKADDVTLNACEAGYSAKGMGLKLDYANARVSDCHAYAISVDGFNLHGYGYSEIVGCTAFYCGDDGISHHEGCSGFIDGGEWAYNGSGGITPAFGAQIDVRNVYAHHNSIGIQWIGLGTQCRYTKMVGCLAVDNTKDVYVKWYVVYAWGNVFRVKDNVYSSARSNLIEYGTVTPE